MTRRKAGAIIAMSRNTGVAKLGITFNFCESLYCTL